VCLPDQPADSREREGTTRMEKTKMPDCHKALGQDVLKKPAEKLHDVKVDGAEACTACCPVGEGDCAVCKADKTVVGDGDFEDIGREGVQGGVAVVIGLTMDIPGAGPDVRIDVLQQTGVAHLVFEKRAVDGREGFHRNKKVGAGRQPGRAVLREPTARHDVVDMRVVLELPAPGMQDPAEPRQVGPDETFVGGEPCEGRGRGVKQGVIRQALMRAEEGAEGFRDGEGEEAVRPRQLFLEVMCKPLLGFMLLTLRAVTVPTGMVHMVVPPTGMALIQAVTILAAWGTVGWR
jgi:hypothetical protein